MVYLPLFDGARNWATQGVINYFEIFSRRVAASSNQIVQWKTQLQERATDLFVTAAERKAVNGPNVKDLHAKIGQLAMESDFLASALGRIDDASAK